MDVETKENISDTGRQGSSGSGSSNSAKPASASANTKLEIDSKDVVRLILQFLKEQNLLDAMKALQQESNVSLNTVDSIEIFSSDIRHGRWDAVLAQVSALKLPQDKLVILYEQVIYELLEAGERDLAREILRTVEPLRTLQSEHPDRYLRLETFCRRPFFNASDVYEMGVTKEKRRREIAESLAMEVSVVQPSRLLALLGQSLRFQQTQGLIPEGVPFDLFRCTRKSVRKDVEDRIPKRLCGEIDLHTAAAMPPKSARAEALCFTADGSTLVVGSGVGYLEAWDPDMQKLRQDLEYQQALSTCMQLEDRSPVSCVTFSKDGDHFATGSQGGKIQIWRMSSGACLRKFAQAHPLGITSLCFAKDGTQVLSTSYDQTARIHGLKSGRTLKEFRGHTSFVNSGMYAKSNSNLIVTASSDGTLKLWDIRTTECQLTFRPGVQAGLAVREVPIMSVQQMPTNAEHLLVCPRSPQAHIVTTHGQLVRTFSSGKATGGDFCAAAVSPQGKYLYCVGEDGVLYVFDVKGGQLEDVVPLHPTGATKSGQAAQAAEAVGIAHHPHRNLLAIIAMDGSVKLWRP